MEKDPYEKLDQHFQKKKITPVLIIEHIESFAKTKRQVILYTLTEWVHKTENVLILIGIVDDLGFESALEKRVKSRFAHNKYFFIKNNFEDLFKILVKRLPKGQGAVRSFGDMGNFIA